MVSVTASVRKMWKTNFSQSGRKSVNTAYGSETFPADQVLAHILPDPLFQFSKGLGIADLP